MIEFMKHSLPVDCQGQSSRWSEGNKSLLGVSAEDDNPSDHEKSNNHRELMAAFKGHSIEPDLTQSTSWEAE
jgi:hypothetical protein